MTRILYAGSFVASVVAVVILVAAGDACHYVGAFWAGVAALWSAAAFFDVVGK